MTDAAIVLAVVIGLAIAGAAALLLAATAPNFDDEFDDIRQLQQAAETRQALGRATAPRSLR